MKRSVGSDSDGPSLSEVTWGTPHVSSDMKTGVALEDALGDDDDDDDEDEVDAPKPQRELHF